MRGKTERCGVGKPDRGVRNRGAIVVDAEKFHPRRYTEFTRLTVGPGGTVHGHLHSWESTPPPASPAARSFSVFHRMAHPLAPVGAIVWGPSAAMDADRRGAIAHYDSRPVVALVRLTVDEFGLACHGVTPPRTDVSMAELMARGSLPVCDRRRGSLVGITMRGEY